MKTNLAILTFLALLAGCGAPQPGAPAAKAGPPTLLVAAASDLQAALPVLVERFTHETGTQVSFTFGASGQLAEQIKAGSPVDVFLSANRKYVQDLASDGFVRSDSVRPYAQGTLVLAVHRESGQPIQTLADLTRADVKKIALANPAVAPYGAAGKQALERAKLWPDLEPKIVQAESVRQALQFVQSGNAEAALVGKSIADVPEVRIVPIDPDLYDPLVQGLGIVARTKQPEAAEKFARFVLGDDGQAVLAKFGFATVAGEGDSPGKEGMP